MRGERYLAAGFALALAACGSMPRPPLDELEEEFRLAAEDTRVAEPSEAAELTPIVAGAPGAEALVWRGDGARRQLLVVAWVAKGSELSRAGAGRLAEELWVTPAPLLAELCRSIGTGERELTLRLEGLLGLPPGAGEDRRVVELWVRPADLFRPCADPEITDRRCEVALAPEVDGEHRRWYQERLRRSDQPGEPLWSRLGYTYDWADPYGEVGLSELVVRAGAEVEVVRVEPTRRYCRRR